MLPYVTVHTDTAHAYGACLIVCANTEVVCDRLGLGLDPTANDAADAAVRAATDAIVRSGLDYYPEHNFSAYNGGSLKCLIEARYAVADIDEDGEPGPWRAAEPETVPADVRAVVDAVIDDAYRAAEAAAREWASRNWAEGVIERATTGDPAYAAFVMRRDYGSSREWAERVRQQWAAKKAAVHETRYQSEPAD